MASCPHLDDALTPMPYCGLTRGWTGLGVLCCKQDKPYGPQHILDCKGDSERFCPGKPGTPLDVFSDYNTSLDIMVRMARSFFFYLPG
jgi:hypothetical protein